MRHRFTPEQCQFLIDNVKGTTEKDLTTMFNTRFGTELTLRQIRDKKQYMNLKNGNDSKFKKGCRGYNYGKKWADYMPKKSQDKIRKNLGRKGVQPVTAKPMFSERIENDGYIWIKISTGKGRRNYVQKHRYIWEQANGKIPDGYSVIFADGNKRNFELNNLILITHQEGLILNKHKLRFNDAELTKTGINIAKLIHESTKS